MLDEMRVLRDAAQAYRMAATAAGVTWPDGAGPRDAPPPDLDLVHRLFDVDRIPEQLSWLLSQGWDGGHLFPDGGQLQPWPAADTAAETLDMLSASVGTPFHWRHQVPLFFFGTYVYTFVLEGDREGEIWRYLISPDTWDPVRAAAGLATLFDQWTAGIAARVVHYSDVSRFLLAGEPSGDLDPLAFPNDIPAALLRDRQRACGVFLDHPDRGFESWEELLEEVLAVQAEFDG
jgi:hypothetical protein